MDEGYIRWRWRLFKRKARRFWKRANEFSRHFVKRYVLRRTPHLRQVQRFVLGWFAILAIAISGLFLQLRALGPYYLTAGGKKGGVITEGVVGQVSLINPIFPDNAAVASANKLIFNGLTRYNGQGQIEADLAEAWEIEEDGSVYTVNLRQDVFWHDGEPFTAEDVEFTFRMIQDPSTNSPLRPAWRNVVITALDEHTVRFGLPNPYAPFLDSLTTGILPAHLLQTAEPSQLRKVDFNQAPVGTGPFKFRDFSLNRNEVRMVANKQYFRDRPALDGYILHPFDKYEDMLEAYRSRSITTAAGLRFNDAKEITDNGEGNVKKIQTSSQLFVFFNTSQQLLGDKALRQALVEATDPAAIIEQLKLEGRPARSPLLAEHIGFNPELSQLEPRVGLANAKLDEAGWTRGQDGFRSKDVQELKLTLLAPDIDFYPTVANLMQQQWGEIGVRLGVELVSPQELQEGYLRRRNYDAVMTAITLGGDPDVYPFWHSTQAADPGLNLSRYNSETADESLEAGRTRLDTELRRAKYEAFLEVWRDDAPAVAIMRLDFYYGLRNSVNGVDARLIIDPADRFIDVEKWTARPGASLRRLSPSPSQ